MRQSTRKEIITAVVNSELNNYFPRGERGSRNNKLRAIYNIMRRHDLSGAKPAGAKVIQAESIALFDYDLKPTEWFKREKQMELSGQG